MEALLETPAVPQTEAAQAPAHRLLRGYLHKTSNSLCGIKGYASLIAGPTGADTDPAQWARKIIAEVERMEAIFRSVGDLTMQRRHPDQGVNLPALLDDVFAVCEARCPGLQILSGRLPHGQILLPKADLCLVLTEILCNAWEGRDGAPHEVAVTVTAVRGPDGRLALRVADDGEGIAPELLAQVRDPFVTTKSGHVGVGLTRVETLMDMYGLAWTLHGAPGAGTVITVEMAEALD